MIIISSMTTLKQLYSKKSDFSLHNSDEKSKILSHGGRLLLTSSAGNNVTLLTKFSLPRSQVIGLGTSIKSLSFNFVLLSGQLVSGSSARLVREKFQSGLPVQLEEIPLLNREDLDSVIIAPSNYNTRRLTWALKESNFDNQLNDESIVYNFSLSLNFASGTYFSPQLSILGFEVEYEFKISGGVGIIDANSTNSTNGNSTSLLPNAAAVAAIYVSKTGNDITGTGTILNPLNSIQAAFSRVVSDNNSGPNKRYAVILGPGNYNVAAANTAATSLSIPANVFVMGQELNSCRIEILLTCGDHPTWAAEGDNRSGISNCIIASNSDMNIDFTKYKKVNDESKFIINNCLINNGIKIKAAGSGNQCRITNSIFFLGGVTQEGCNSQFFNCTFLSYKPISVKSSETKNPTLIQLFNGSGNGDVIVSSIEEYGPVVANIIGYTSTSGRIKASGKSVLINATASCISAAPILTDGASINYGTSAAGIKYEPSLEGIFENNTTPANLQETIDRILAALTKLNIKI